MRTKNLLVVLLIISIIVLGTSDGLSKFKDISTGIKAEEFVLANIEGELVKLSDFQGKVIVLNFWATWCPPCIKEIPHFNELSEALKDKGVVFIGISVDRGGVSVVKDFLEKTPINYPILMYNESVYATYQSYLPSKDQGGIPFTFIIDQMGNIREHFVGYRPKEVWDTSVKKVLNK